MTSSSPTRTFLEALFGLKPDGTWILIWTLPDRKSHWTDTVDKAVSCVENLPADREVYFGVGLSPGKLTAKSRAKASDVAAITCLWADIDIAHGVHTKKRLPPDEAAARKVIEAVGVGASVVVQSGHGLQVYWILKEPWLLETEDERKKAADFSQRFSTALRQAAAGLGYEIDAVGDLSRIMRVPGTRNNKDPGKPVDVRILDIEENRGLDHAIEEFEEFLSGVEAGDPVDVPKKGKKFDLSPGAYPPFDKFQALLDNSKKFKDTWDHDRVDLSDTSASGHDLSLAVFALRAGWTDQEAVNLMIACRRQHGDPLKLREDYYDRTVSKARKFVESRQAEEEVNEEDDKPIETPEDRKEQLDQLSKALGFPSEWIRMYNSSEPEFRMKAGGKEIRLGDVATLLEQRPFRNAVARAVLLRVPTFSSKRWERMSAKLLKLVETIEVGEEATLHGQVEAWLEVFLEKRGVIDSVEDGLQDRVTFQKDNDVYIHLAPLKTWIFINFGDRISSTKLATSLTAFGCEEARPSAKCGNKIIQRRVYRIPKEIAKPFRINREDKNGDGFGAI